MNDPESNGQLWRRLLRSRLRILILATDAFVGGTIGGFASALVASGIKPQVFNFHDGLEDLLKMALGCGLVSAAAYLRQRPQRSKSRNGSYDPPQNPS